MVELSFKLSNKIAKIPNEIFIDQLRKYINKQNFKDLSPHCPSETLFDQIRNGILKKEDYKIPNEFHEEIKRFDQWYCCSLYQMKLNINKMLSEIKLPDEQFAKTSSSNTSVDFYKKFNSDNDCRKIFFDVIFKHRCNYSEQLPILNSFDDIPSFSIFLKF